MTAIVRRHLGSTYRLQLNGLGFVGATALVPFLDQLGVETMYVSPVAQARSGSTHGYDVIDPTRLDPALGTPAEFEALLAALDQRGIGLLVDIVPNHMAASTESPFFADVLRLGRGSLFASWFDIAWAEQDDRILLPVLGDDLPAVIDRGELRVIEDKQGLATLAYFDARFPLAPETLASAATTPIAELLASQHYRLADWRLANQQVNYRRFFDINELIGLRQEDPAVFTATHPLVLDLLGDPRVRGVRVDHIDGLRDPGGYLDMLRAVTADLFPPPVVVVEKILEGDEQLPDWPVEGTTGYELGAALIDLLVEPAGATEIRLATAVASGDDRSFGVRALEAKRKALTSLFPVQAARVERALATTLSEGDVPAMTEALTELTAQLDVYRTYRQADAAVRPGDVDTVLAAAKVARSSLDGEAAEALDRTISTLLGPAPVGSASWDAIAGWQQLSGPATAKGVEDTAMYDSGGLIALADVGSTPDVPGLAPVAFHEAMVARAERYPAALSSTSTHDSKRSHDLRCRLAVLSEIAPRWNETVEELDAVLGVSAPDAADRRYLYQTLVGAWPLTHGPDPAFVEQVRACLLKSAREAKRHSTWASPDQEYEKAYTALATQATAGRAGELLAGVVAEIECAGATNSLASVLLKATVPGVPDVYQGDDDWFFALVDPDNRRMIDVAHHEKLMDQPTDRLLDQWRDGPIKQHVLRRALQTRRALPELFAVGAYEPLDVVGHAADHVVAFARRTPGRCVITVVPRLVQALAGPGRFAVGPTVWGDTRIVVPSGCPGAGLEVLAGRRVGAADDAWLVAKLLVDLPVALLDTGDVD